jgi:hypothetical protein
MDPTQQCYELSDSEYFAYKFKIVFEGFQWKFAYYYRDLAEQDRVAELRSQVSDEMRDRIAARRANR